MKRILGMALPDADLDHAWPIAEMSGDPFAGDEALFMGGSYRDYLLHCERLGVAAELDQAGHGGWDARFEQIYRQILDGHEDASAIEPAAQALLVWGPRRHDSRPLPAAAHLISDQQLADIAENQLPLVGQVAPDRFLGPWADTALPRWVRVVAAAAMAFPPEVRPGVPAWARAIKRHPRPEPPERAAIRAIARVPPMLWRITGPGQVAAHLPLGERQLPDGPVDGLPDAPAVIGRVLWTGTGWRLACGLPLPALPPAEPLIRRLDLELMRLRRRERRLSWEVLLRERSEVLYRTACEWLWLGLKDGTEMPWR